MTREEAVKRLETCDECGDCLTCAAHDEALGMAISALREQESAENAHCNSCKKCNSWISVEDALPGKRMDVLIFTWDCDTYIADYIPSVKQWWVENDLRSDVSHWMPLPEPPKEEV